MPRTTITFSSPGALPPVFIAGSFTEPPWNPEELEHNTENGKLADISTEQPDLRFYKAFDVPPGRWQYKFRLGLGDWWVCDKHTEIGEAP